MVYKQLLKFTLQSHEPSAQPSRHRSLTRSQSNIGFPSFLLTSLWALQNHRDRLLWESTTGVLVFSLWDESELILLINRDKALEMPQSQLQRMSYFC